MDNPLVLLKDNLFKLYLQKKINMKTLYLLSFLNKEIRDSLIDYYISARLTFSEIRILTETIFDYKKSDKLSLILTYINNRLTKKELFSLLKKEFTRP
ncbi:MAG: hypothetical protein AB1765_00710 [Candidatus Hydrogenedentota bacterium]